MAEGEWNQEYERSPDNDDAYSFDDLEEQEWMEERQAKTPKNINQLWREANPISWTIKRIEKVA